MRLDKFLKTTGIIKRRTISDEICKNGNVLVNGVAKKSAYEVKVGDFIEVKYFDKKSQYKVLQIPPKQIKQKDILKYIEME